MAHFVHFKDRSGFVLSLLLIINVDSAVILFAFETQNMSDAVCFNLIVCFRILVLGSHIHHAKLLFLCGLSAGEYSMTITGQHKQCLTNTTAFHSQSERFTI